MKTLDILSAIGGIVAGVIGTLGVGAGIFFSKSRSDSDIANRRETEVAELLRLKDEARAEIERQRDVERAENKRLTLELNRMKTRISDLENQMRELMVSVSLTDLCTNAQSCPNRKMPERRKDLK